MSQINKVSKEELGKLSFLSDSQIESVQRIGGGNNNKVYDLTLDTGEHRVLKFYFYHPNDSRDRMKTEYQSLEFLWKQGLRCIAEPLFVDEVRRCALYSFIEGESGCDMPLLETDLDQAISFAFSLKEISIQPQAHKLGIASEATFSYADLLQIINARLKRLSAVKNNPAQQKLNDFLHELSQFYFEVSNWSKERIKSRGGSINDKLNIKECTLSPSDFGFHNGLRNPSGKWYFIDFEYFGWDDSAKLIADFILHPGMTLSPTLQSYFVQLMYNKLGESSDICIRLPEVYPLYALKWCLIILNEFVPEFIERRGFATLSHEDLYARQMIQLTKATRLIDNVSRCYKDFNSFFKVEP